MEISPVALASALAAGIQARLNLVELVGFLWCNNYGPSNWLAINAILAFDFTEGLRIDFVWYAVAWHALAIFALASMLLDDVNACQKDSESAKNENHQLIDLVRHLLNLNDSWIQNRWRRISKRT